MFLDNEKMIMRSFRDIFLQALEICPIENPMRLRCHEMARFFANAFRTRGIERVRVCDGFVAYRITYLVEVIELFGLIPGFLGVNAGFRHEETDQEAIDSIIHILQARDIIDFRHSWCELLFNGFMWRVDFHPNMIIPDKDGNKVGDLRWWSVHEIKSSSTDEQKYWHLCCGKEVVEGERRFIEVQRPDMPNWHYREELRPIPEFS